MVPLFQIIIIRRKLCVSFNFWERFSLPSEFRATFLKKNHESIIDRSSFFFPREHDRDRDPEYVRLWSWPEVSIYTQLNVPQRGKTGADFDAVESTAARFITILHERCLVTHYVTGRWSILTAEIMDRGEVPRISQNRFFSNRKIGELSIPPSLSVRVC